MKKIILLLLIVTALACKNSSKTTGENSESVKKEEFPKEVITSLKVSNEVYELGKAAVKFSESEEIFTNKKVYFLSRTNSNLKSSFAYTRKINVDFADVDRASVIVKNVRDFENESPTIQDFGNGLYKCSVIAEVAADGVSILFGPTSQETKANGWEINTKELYNTHILVSSLPLEKVSY